MAEEVRIPISFPIPLSSPIVSIDLERFPSLPIGMSIPKLKVELRKLETAILHYYGRCPEYIVNNLAVGTFAINDRQLRDYGQGVGRFDDHFQRDMKCLVDAITYPTNSKNSAQHLKNWIKHITQAGKATESYVYFIGGEYVDDLFVLKMSQRTQDNLTHEGIVGFLALNPLRVQVPTFMYVYGVFFCSPPFIEKGALLSWCTDATSEEVTYLISEAINDAETLFRFAKQEANPVVLGTIFFQIFHALDLAHSAVDFTHYDLHSENVLIVKVPNPVYIPYRERYIATSHVAYIIDYGRSHFRYQNRNFGIPGLDIYGIYWDKSFPAHDIYKLICFLGETANHYNKTLFPVLEELFAYFEDRSLLQRINQRKGRENLDYYTAETKYQTRTYADFLTYMETKLPTPFLVKSGVEPTRCNPNCISMQSFVDLAFTSGKQVNTVADYCVAGVAIEHLPEPEKYIAWLLKVPLETLIDEEASRLQDRIITSHKILQDIYIPIIEEDNYTTYVNDPIFGRNYLADLRSLIYAREIISDIRFWLENAKCALKFRKTTGGSSRDEGQILAQEAIEDVESDFKPYIATYEELKSQALYNGENPLMENLLPIKKMDALLRFL